MTAWRRGPSRPLAVSAAPTSSHPEDGVAVVSDHDSGPGADRDLGPDRDSGPRADPGLDREPGDQPGSATIGHIGAPDLLGRRPVEVVVDGWRFEFLVEDAARAELRERASRDRTGAAAGGGTLEIRAIIPGRVVAVAVAAGDQVEAGDALLVVEAMKMQNELRAARAGTVVRVTVGAGSTVDVGDVLVVLE